MTPLTLPRLLAALLVAAGAINLPAGAAAVSQAGAAAHDHGHAQAAQPLKPGQRWATDAPLREGMTKIRAALEPQLPGVHGGTLSAAQYRALAAQTETQVGYIVAHCKLTPEADAALHGILAQIGEGTEAMAGKSALKPREGAVKLVAALDEYGRSFDHPGWKPLSH